MKNRSADWLGGIAERLRGKVGFEDDQMSVRMAEKLKAKLGEGTELVVQGALIEPTVKRFGERATPCVMFFERRLYDMGSSIRFVVCGAPAGALSRGKQVNRASMQCRPGASRKNAVSMKECPIYY